MASEINWSECLEYAALTDVGMRRANNQDAHAAVLAPDAEHWHRRGHIFVVCDGMGAHAAGELASQIACDSIPHTYLKLRDHAPDALLKSVIEANSQIFNRGQANPDFQGMGTTASTLVLLPQGALAAHVGDSRVYRLRGKKLEQLTFDHSLVWEMSAAGQVPKDALPNFVPKNIITRSLGPHPSVQVDLEGPYPLEPGDMFLLCSDGLTGQVCDEELGAIMQCMPPKEAAQLLIDMANLRGGPDNITVVIVRVVGPGMTAAGGVRIEPLPLSEQTEVVTTVPPWSAKLWATAGAFLAGAIGLGAFLDQQLAAIICLAIAVILSLVAVLQRLPSGGPGVRYLMPGMRLGRGPHAVFHCEPNERLISELASMLQQLREAAFEEKWEIDWPKIDAHSLNAKEMIENHQLAAAVREYGAALRLMMQQLRTQRASHVRNDVHGR